MEKTGNKVAAIWEVLEFILFIASQNKPKRTGPKLELQNVLFISTFALALEPEFGQLLSNSTRRLRWRLRQFVWWVVKKICRCLNTFWKQLKFKSHNDSFPLSATTLIIFSALNGVGANGRSVQRRRGPELVGWSSHAGGDSKIGAIPDVKHTDLNANVSWSKTSEKESSNVSSKMSEESSAVTKKSCIKLHKTHKWSQHQIGSN